LGHGLEGGEGGGGGGEFWGLMPLVGELEKKVAHVREIQRDMPQKTDEEVAQTMFDPDLAALRTMRKNFGKND